jgi:Na+-driven multidrug efflux pump
VTSFAIGCCVALLLYASIGPIVARVAAPAAVASTLARTGGDAAAAAVTSQLWAACETYVRIRALSFPFALTLMAAQASCLGAKDSLSPTLATFVASVVNVVGDYILVLGPLAMGIAGAAWATVGCQLAAALMLLRTLRAKGMLDGPTLRRLPSRSELRRFFAFGAFVIVLFVKQLVYNQVRTAAPRKPSDRHRWDPN